MQTASGWQQSLWQQIALGLTSAVEQRFVTSTITPPSLCFGVVLCVVLSSASWLWLPAVTAPCVCWTCCAPTRCCCWSLLLGGCWLRPGPRRGRWCSLLLQVSGMREQEGIYRGQLQLSCQPGSPCWVHPMHSKACCIATMRIQNSACSCTRGVEPTADV